MIDYSNNSQNNLIFKSISSNFFLKFFDFLFKLIKIFEKKKGNLSTEMPSIESSILSQPKHLCIRLATGPQYYS